MAFSSNIPPNELPFWSGQESTQSLLNEIERALAAEAALRKAIDNVRNSGLFVNKGAVSTRANLPAAADDFDLYRISAENVDVYARNIDSGLVWFNISAPPLSDSVTSTSSTTGASSKAAKTAYDAAGAAQSAANAANTAAGAAQSTANQANTAASAAQTSANAVNTSLNTHIADKAVGVHGSATAATANTIAMRGTGGTLNVGTPTAATHAVTKTYVDAGIGDVLIVANAAALTAVWGSITGAPSDFTPSKHKDTHKTGGTDAISPADIGAAAVNHSEPLATGQTAGHVKPGASIGINAGVISVLYGSVANTACQGNDSRLSNARTPTTHASTHNTGGADAITNLNASVITSGTIDIARLPAGALDRLKIVATDAARYALTTADVQTGDTVQVTATGIMYRVVDDTKLSTAAGYVEYTAARASAVPWSGVMDKPSNFTPSAHASAHMEGGTDVINVTTAAGTAANTPPGTGAMSVQKWLIAARNHLVWLAARFDSAGKALVAVLADTATKLATARKINGVDFDGTKNITVADATKVDKAGDAMTGDLSMNNNSLIQFATSVANPKINLYSTTYSVGIQNSSGGLLSTLYLRTAGVFRFYKGGVHQTTAGAGTGGTEILTLDNNSAVFNGYITALVKTPTVPDAIANKAYVDNRSLETLTAAKTLYVRTDGNDANTGSANNAANAFKTLQGAYNYIAKNTNLGQYNITISIAAGTYVGRTDVSSYMAATGIINIQGAGAGSTILENSDDSIIYMQAASGSWQVRNMTMRVKGTTTTTTYPAAIVANTGCQMYIGGVAFEFSENATTAAYIRGIIASQGGYVQWANGNTITCTGRTSGTATRIRPFYITGGSTLELIGSGPTTISGNGYSLVNVFWHSRFMVNTGFSPSHTFAGSWTGIRATAEGFCVISVANKGAAFFPGTGAVNIIDSVLK